MLGGFACEECGRVDAAAMCDDPKAVNVAVKRPLKYRRRELSCENTRPLCKAGEIKQGGIIAGVCAGKQREVTLEIDTEILVTLSGNGRYRFLMCVSMLGGCYEQHEGYISKSKKCI